jgi:hypothetical protein
MLGAPREMKWLLLQLQLSFQILPRAVKTSVENLQTRFSLQTVFCATILWKHLSTYPLHS